MATIRLQGQTWFSRSLYSFHSEQAEQKSSALEHLCWRTPEYSVFRGGVDRTVTWPVPKKMADHCLHAWIYFVSLDLFRSTPSAQFYLFRWMFWRTPSTLKIAKSSPPQVYYFGVESFTDGWIRKQCNLTNRFPNVFVQGLNLAKNRPTSLIWTDYI